MIRVTILVAIDAGQMPFMQKSVYRIPPIAANDSPFIINHSIFFLPIDIDSLDLSSGASVYKDFFRDRILK
jgi:hypothetical protein